MMIELTGQNLTIEDVVAVARRHEKLAPLNADARRSMEATRQWVEDALLKDAQPLYGVNTGVGPLSHVRVSPAQARRLSRNLILSNAAGVGDALPEEIVRATMVLRANSLVPPHSGVRPEVVETLIRMLNLGVTPLVPAKGSVGASGDLAPLAHIALVLSCDPDGDPDAGGQAWYNGDLLNGAGAMQRAGIPRIKLEAKEGLSLINGTGFMAGVAALAVYDAEKLLEQAEIAAALSCEGLLGITAAFDPAIQEVNRQAGQIETADHLRELLAGSRLVNSLTTKVQDAYSLRCIPQVIGPVRDILEFIRSHIAGALNAPCDNPLILPDLDPQGSFRVLSGGNFHGQGLAIWMDTLGIAMCAIGNISERRIFRMTAGELSAGLPSMLVESGGLDSGFMIAQYTAAALVSDNKTLAHPDSVDSVPTSGNQEDHVSMGANAARHTWEVLRNVRDIVAIELLAAAQAVDLRPDGPSRLGSRTREAYEKIRKNVAYLEHDRELSADILILSEMVANQEFL